nr:spore coat protein [Paenibacillus faecalis]
MTSKHTPEHLAWHETLEIHELTAYQSNNLINFKMSVNDIKDTKLHALYVEAIKSIEKNLKELLQYYPEAPQCYHNRAVGVDMTAFYAGQLLGFAKTSVRSYAIAITETATPRLRETLTRQLNHAIMLHAKVFNFMYERGLYPAYDLNQLLANDVKNANTALSL